MSDRLRVTKMFREAQNRGKRGWERRREKEKTERRVDF